MANVSTGLKINEYGTTNPSQRHGSTFIFPSHRLFSSLAGQGCGTAPGEKVLVSLDFCHSRFSLV